MVLLIQLDWSCAMPDSVAYITRTREYYQAQGFDKAYSYAQHDDAPFTPLAKPLTQCTVGLVTTASTTFRAPLEPRKIDSGSTLNPPQRLYTDDLSWDKQATHTDDLNSFCPIKHLDTLGRRGVIGSLAPRFHCAATEYSHRATLEQDAPEILRRLQEDQADVALLVPL
jgi:D-proline reductase (dithiol) PrdB